MAFDLGIDARSGGIWQLHEACEMLRLLYRDDDEMEVGHRPQTDAKPNIVINHLCKPNLQLKVIDILGGHAEYLGWKRCVEEMAKFPATFMKLSGLFSELPPQDWGHASCLEKVVGTLKPWTDVVFDAFGPSRIMFGSDWPVCNVGGPGAGLSWTYWHDVVETILSGRAVKRYKGVYVSLSSRDQT